MSFYNNLCRYKKLMEIDSHLHYLLSLFKLYCGKMKMGIKNKKRLARRPDELYRRTFSYSSFLEEEGYLTVESALVIPVFVFVTIIIMYFFIILSTDMEIYRAMKETSGDIGYIEALFAPENDVAGRDLSIKADMTKNLGTNFFTGDLIKGGISGLDVSDSTYDKETGVLDIIVSYEYKIPFSFLNIGNIERRQRFKSRLFTGMKIVNDEKEEEYVFVTKNGSVYHLDRNCSYLNFNIKMVLFNEVDGCRNKWGEKYYPCENCMKKDELECKNVFITEDGNRYHSSQECCSLNRDVYMKKLSEVEGMKPCSRCGRKNE